MTNNQLTEFAERKVKHLTQAIGQSAFTSIRLELENELALAKFALSALQEHRKAAEPVGDEELDQMIWKLERDGMTPKMLSLMRELREVRRAKPVVPEALPCPVFLEPGLKFGKGVRTQCMLDALNRRAEYHAELEAMTPEQRAEHDAGIAEFKAMLGGYDRNNAWTSINELGRYDGDEVQNEVSCMPRGEERIRRLRHALGVVPLTDDEMSTLLNTEKLNQPVREAYKLPSQSSNDVNDAAWKLFDMLTEHGPLNGYQFNNLKECFYEALKVAMRHSPADPDGLIPVSERMPELGEDVLVSKEFFGPGDWRIKVGHIQSESKEWRVYGATWIPTHWQPLPAAPKEVG